MTRLLWHKTDGWEVTLVQGQEDVERFLEGEGWPDSLLESVTLIQADGHGAWILTGRDGQFAGRVTKSDGPLPDPPQQVPDPPASPQTTSRMPRLLLYLSSSEAPVTVATGTNNVKRHLEGWAKAAAESGIVTRADDKGAWLLTGPDGADVGKMVLEDGTLPELPQQTKKPPAKKQQPDASQTMTAWGLFRRRRRR
jgi:hypothetical protein